MSHHVFRVNHEAKFDLTASIANRTGRSILFVRTKHGADRLAKNLSKAGVAAGALHGDRTQSQRTRALEAFKDGSVPVLVATDVAARGIHVDDVSLVLHVDPPADVKDYLHRSGRTARAGEDGTVVMLVTSLDERKALKMLAEGGVKAEVVDAQAGHPTVGRVTGARTPSGVSVLAPKPQQTKRVGPSGRAAKAPGARRRPNGNRPAAASTANRPAAAAGARHPQSGERRPRRDRTR